jgi:hypothetical protein
LPHRLAAAQGKHREGGEGAGQRTAPATQGTEWFSSLPGAGFFGFRKGLGDGIHGWDAICQINGLQVRETVGIH